MTDLRISPISRTGTAERTWLAWTSATDRLPDEIDLDIAESRSHRSRPSISDIDYSESLPFARHGTDLRVDTRNRQQADDFYHLESRSTTLGAGPTLDQSPAHEDSKPAACRYPILNPADSDDSTDFEPVEDSPLLPRLDFKPLILRKSTLIIIATFYAGLIAGIGVLYWFENNARIFHVRATASHFTIRILPSIIGSLSTIIFQSVSGNFARMLPYINMASSGLESGHSNWGSCTLLAEYFPFLNIFHAYRNRHYALIILTVVQIYFSSFVTPLKAALIHRKVAEDDPNLWTISISAGAAQALIFIYSVYFLLMVAMCVYLWERRTGLKWDPVAMADHLTLFQGSNALDDFCGLEYFHQSAFQMWWRGSVQFQHLKNKSYRLGYWRHKPTKRYWHGIRKWPPPSYETPLDPLPGNIHDAPSMTDVSSEAKAWWADQYLQVQSKPERYYVGLYNLISDIPAMITYLVATGFAGGGLYFILTDRLNTGFTYSRTNLQLANILLNSVPSFVVQLIGGYWYQLDIWYRQLQPFMGLRQPSPATENLLLGYPCDLPVVVTIKALTNGHWRLAFTSIMPLVQRLLPILVGSVFSVVNITDKDFHIGIAALPFRAATGLLLSYLILIPVAWPGLNRRLPFLPSCIANPLVLLYDSTLVRKDAFLPRSLNEQRWHMEYRLCLEERLYGFGVYRGRYDALHIGIDDVYGHSSDEMGFRFVAPLKPPRRWYCKWLRSAWIWTSQKTKIKRQSTLQPEEFEAQQRLHVELQDLTRPDQNQDAESATPAQYQNRNRNRNRREPIYQWYVEQPASNT